MDEQEETKETEETEEESDAVKGPSFHTLSLIEKVKKNYSIILFLSSFRFVEQKISTEQ